MRTKQRDSDIIRKQYSCSCNCCTNVTFGINVLLEHPVTSVDDWPNSCHTKLVKIFFCLVLVIFFFLTTHCIKFPDMQHRTAFSKPQPDWKCMGFKSWINRLTAKPENFFFLIFTGTGSLVNALTFAGAAGHSHRPEGCPAGRSSRGRWAGSGPEASSAGFLSRSELSDVDPSPAEPLSTSDHRYKIYLNPCMWTVIGRL